MAKYNNGEYGSGKRSHAQDDSGIKAGLTEKAKITESPEQLGQHAVGMNQKPGANPKKKIAGGHICW
jgi:hypothetical protein